MKQEALNRILIVDDEERNIEFIKNFLKARGFSADGVLGGEKALEVIKSNPPDLVITEVMTSGIDGFEVTKKIRAERATRTLPVIIVTAQNSKSDRIKAIECGADEFISKPVDKEEVVKRASSLLELNFYRSLIDEKKKLDAIVEGMSDGIVIMEPDFRVIRFNGAAKQLLGLKKKVPREFSLLDHLYRHFKVSLMRKQLEKGHRKMEQIRILRPESEKLKALYISGRITRLIDPLGTISSIVITLRDVTDQVREELQKEAFLSSISHKLRTPATVMMGMLRLLKDEAFGILKPNQKDFLQKIQDSADVISQLIEKLITFNTLTRRELMMEGKYLSLAEFMRSLEERVNENYAHRRITLKVGDFSRIPDCYFNYLQLEMIFWHLIDNAIKFNDKHAPLVKIQGRVDRKGRIEITISDNGPGIPPENHDLIFSQFYQYERFYTGNVEGLGLGLSMVKKIIEDWGQKITLDSTFGKGTTFSFTLPTRAIG